MTEFKVRKVGLMGCATSASDMDPLGAIAKATLESSIIFELDSRGRILGMNSRFLDLSGYEEDDLLGKDMQCLNADIRLSSIFSELWQSISKERVWRGEICCRAKNGDFFWLDAVISPFCSRAGDVLSYFCLCSDVTQRVAIEQKLQSEKVKVINSTRMASLGEMAAGIAHEINNPLTVLKGRLRSLSNKLSLGEVQGNYLLEVLEKMDGTVDRISIIIKGLKTFSRDGEKDEIKEVFVAELLKDTFEFCKNRLENEGIAIRVENAADSEKVNCRSVQVSQVLLNLIQNARDAVFQTSGPWIEIITWKDFSSQEICISVSDSGLGIPGEMQEKIFEPFYTTKDVGKGTGLGLSLSRQLIESHGGSLKIDDESPHTRFIVRLPVEHPGSQIRPVSEIAVDF